MSQPGNYRYQPYTESTGSLKGGPPLMVNGQPSAMQHTQNGVQQPPSFNSAGTPSSQSSRDPSREPSRDPSPTQYLHNQYRPQLPRPPMPPINGQQQQQPGLSNVPMSQPPRGLQPRQSSPLVNTLNPTNQIAPMQPPNPAMYSPQPTQLPLSSFIPESQQIAAPNASQKSVTPTRYDYPSPNRSMPGTPGSQTGPDSQGRPSPMPIPAQTIGGQNLPPTGQIQSQPSWSKESSASSSVSNTPNEAATTVTNNQQWRNAKTDPNSNNFQITSQPYTGGQGVIQPQTSALPPSWSKDSSSVPPPNQPVTVANPNQTWRNPNGDPNSNNNQPYAGLSQKNLPARNQAPPPSQNSNFGLSPMSGASQQNPSYLQQSQQAQIANKANPANARSAAAIVGPQASPAMTSGVNSSMHNVYGGAQPGQTSQVPNQKLPGPQMPHPSLAKPQAQYPTTPVNAFGSQPNLTAPGVSPVVNQSNQSAYGSQQNLASQRKYPRGAYGAQLPPGSPGVTGPPTGTTTAGVGGVAPAGMGQVPMRPPTSGAPPLPGQQPPSQYDNRSPYFGQMSNVPLDNMTKRYPTASYPDQMNQLNTQMGNLNVTQAGFNELWGHQTVDLLQCRNILPPERVEPPKIKLHQEFLDSVNCSSDIFRCTLTKIPESNSLLQKCRLPLGVLIHPFKDLNHLPVIQCSTIVRCRSCRTYINPFVYFVDSKRWKCNLCYRVNELPEEFQFDPVTKSYGDPSRRPEVKTSTIEFIAPSEYMLRPPQPAVYLFLLDVSRLAVESGYLTIVCETIAEELTKLPGDGRTQVGFMAIDSAIHFFSMPDNVSQPHELIMLDVDDVFLPCPDNLIVNLKEREELIRDLLAQLPTKFNGTHDTNSALGAGLQVAFKLMSPTGGRVTVFQTCLPNVGPGALQQREDPNTRASKDVPHLNPATDFYKRLALDCSGQQIAVDLFLLNSQYSDLATLSGMCKFSGGCMYHIPLFRTNKPQHSETLEKMLRRYLTRKIGFEAVMRIRCTRGLSIHTFHGNFFVRSTDLLSLPNVNPDAGFGMQVSIEENLADVQSVCFQAALLYTSSKGERRIRVHTLCLPVSSSMTDILYSADQQAIIGLLSKMAVDRSQQSSLSDARDALINVAIDVLSAYKLSQSSATGGLLAPGNLKLLPLYIIALIKCIAFRSGTSTRLDDRVYAMCQMKSLPLVQLIQMVYPDLYPVHALDDRNSKDIDGKVCPQPPRLHLSAEKLDFRGVFLMDAGDRIFVYVGKSVNPMFICNVLGIQAFASIPEEFYDLPELDTVESERLRNFVFSLQEEKPYYAPVQIIRDDSHFRSLFTDRLIEDRFESALSYYEFLQHLKTQVK